MRGQENVLGGRERGKKGWEAFAKPDNGGWQGGRSCAGARGAPLKSLDSDENFRPEHTLSKTVFLGQEVHYYMVYIAYFTELILQICANAQKRRA